jgi:hypothetical protein
MPYLKPYLFQNFSFNIQESTYIEDCLFAQFLLLHFQPNLCTPQYVRVTSLFSSTQLLHSTYVQLYFNVFRITQPMQYYSACSKLLRLFRLTQPVKFSSICSVFLGMSGITRSVQYSLLNQFIIIQSFQDTSTCSVLCTKSVQDYSYSLRLLSLFRITIPIHELSLFRNKAFIIACSEITT